jgi:hypothetical protein
MASPVVQLEALDVTSRVSNSGLANCSSQQQEADGEGNPQGRPLKAKRKVALHVAYCGTGFSGNARGHLSLHLSFIAAECTVMKPY